MTELPENGALRRDLSFAYRVYRPQDADGEALVLLHGSGVDETTLVPLARRDRAARHADGRARPHRPG